MALGVGGYLYHTDTFLGSFNAASHVCVLILQEAFVTSEEFGEDLEHVEVLQKKFDEFQKVIFGVQI